MGRAIHHYDLWAVDAPAARGEWGWLFGELDWGYDGDSTWTHDDGTYVVLREAPPRPGVGHLAFPVSERALLDRIRAESTAHGWHERFADRYPHAGGDDHTALFLESSEGFEVQIVWQA